MGQRCTAMFNAALSLVSASGMQLNRIGQLDPSSILQLITLKTSLAIC